MKQTRAGGRAPRGAYPNHMHLVSNSLCPFFFENGRQVFDDTDAYKTDEFWAGRKHLKLWRYILIDDHSGCLKVDYHQHPEQIDEDAMWEFLCFAWGGRKGFRGLPQVLVCAERSTACQPRIRRALEALEVEVLATDLDAIEAKEHDGLAPLKKWQRIRPGKLRELPPDARDILG